MLFYVCIHVSYISTFYTVQDKNIFFDYIDIFIFGMLLH